MKLQGLNAVIAAGLLASAVLLAPGSLAEDGYYKWDDERGRPQLSDRPPPAGVEYEYISTDTGLRRRVTAEESHANSEDGSMAPAMPKGPGDPEDMGEMVAIEKDPALCDQAKANLDTLNSSARVRIRDGDTIRYLSEEEKEGQREKARDMITRHCN